MKKRIECKPEEAAVAVLANRVYDRMDDGRWWACGPAHYEGEQWLIDAGATFYKEVDAGPLVMKFSCIGFFDPPNGGVLRKHFFGDEYAIKDAANRSVAIFLMEPDQVEALAAGKKLRLEVVE
jgi:hypothetical protein